MIFQSLGTTVINQFTISDNISPMFPTGNPELALSFIFWLYWLCKAKTSSKLGKSCSTRSLDMIPDSKSGRKNKRSSTFKLRTWLFSVWKNSENIINKLVKTHKIIEIRKIQMVIWNHQYIRELRLLSAVFKGSFKKMTSFKKRDTRFHLAHFSIIYINVEWYQKTYILQRPSETTQIAVKERFC